LIEKEAKNIEIQKNMEEICEQALQKDNQIKEKDERIRRRDAYIS
jgi:hypothetical protein